MGQIVKQVAEGTTRYYWYPGDKRDWVRAGLAVGVGLATFGLLLWISRDILISVTLGISITAAIGGVNFRRRDLPAAPGVSDASRKAAPPAAPGHRRPGAPRRPVGGGGGAAPPVL